MPTITRSGKSYYLRPIEVDLEEPVCDYTTPPPAESVSPSETWRLPPPFDWAKGASEIGLRFPVEGDGPSLLYPNPSARQPSTDSSYLRSTSAEDDAAFDRNCIWYADHSDSLAPCDHCNTLTDNSYSWYISDLIQPTRYTLCTSCTQTFVAYNDFGLLFIGCTCARSIKDRWLCCTCRQLVLIDFEVTRDCKRSRVADMAGHNGLNCRCGNKPDMDQKVVICLMCDMVAASLGFTLDA
ncbi:MAG: hypothetical protein M1827_005612 [Pycnora praestabilis]|nr:MAG: hypothetical protein M1827_005612 [Pycnora praestabilis]